jgi:MFS family permease
VLTVIELMLLPVFVRVASHVLAMDERDEVPTVTGAWRRARENKGTPPGAAGNTALMLAGAIVLGLAVGFLTEATLMLVADLVPDEAAFGFIALARAVGHSAGAAFVVVALLSVTGRTKPAPDEEPELY